VWARDTEAVINMPGHYPSEFFSGAPLSCIWTKKHKTSQDPLRTKTNLSFPKLSIGSRRGLGSGRKAHSLIASVIDAVETLQEGVSVDEIKTFARVRTNLF
jgi:hypothetical protein